MALSMRHFSWLWIDVGEPTVGRASPGQGVLNCVRKVAEQKSKGSRRRKQFFMSFSSVPFLTSLGDELTLGSVRKQVFPQVASGQSALPATKAIYDSHQTALCF